MKYTVETNKGKDVGLNKKEARRLFHEHKLLVNLGKRIFVKLLKGDEVIDIHNKYLG